MSTEPNYIVNPNADPKKKAEYGFLAHISDEDRATILAITDEEERTKHIRYVELQLKSMGR